MSINVVSIICSSVPSYEKSLSQHHHAPSLRSETHHHLGRNRKTSQHHALIIIFDVDEIIACSALLDKI